MRVSQFSRLTSITYTLAAIILGGTLFATTIYVDGIQGQLQHYQSLRQRINMDVYRSIEHYLSNGDPQMLKQAEDLLLDMDKRQLTQLPDDVAAPIHALLTPLLKKLATDYRALGKMSGNDQALLLNAERQISGYAESLLEYGLTGFANNQQSARSMIITAKNILSTMGSISALRNEYIQTGNNAKHQALNQQLSYLQEQVASLRKLPLLGIYHEVEVDPFALGDPEPPEDKGEEILNELRSWSNRYPLELTNTIEQVEQRSGSEVQLRKDMQALEQEITEAEALLVKSRQQANTTVAWVFGVLFVLMLLLSAGSYLGQKYLVLTPLRMLRDAIRSLVEEGVINQVSLNSSNNEMSEIADYFNTLIGKLEKDNLRMTQQLQLVSSALNMMEKEVSNISHCTQVTQEEVVSAEDVLQQLTQLTQSLNHTAEQMAANARETETAMQSSKDKTQDVIVASQQTVDIVASGNQALTQLGTSVSEVSAVLDVIRTIAEQTNLLALNAAIESARAGEHGRGFAVVADEVRKLAMKTQESLEQTGEILKQLQLSSQSLTGNVNDIEQAAKHQSELAASLMETADSVQSKATQASEVSAEVQHTVQQQSNSFDRFSHSMAQVKDQVDTAGQLANQVFDEVSKQIHSINQSG